MRLIRDSKRSDAASSINEATTILKHSFPD